MTKFPVFNNLAGVWKTVCMVLALVMVVGVAGADDKKSGASTVEEKVNEKIAEGLASKLSTDQIKNMIPGPCKQANDTAEESSKSVIKACNDARIASGDPKTCFQSAKKCVQSLGGEGAEKDREDAEKSNKTCEEYSEEKVLACPQLYRGSKADFLKEAKEADKELAEAQEKVTSGQEKLQKLQKDQNDRNLKIREEVEKIEQKKVDIQIALQDNYRELDAKNDEQVQAIQNQISELTEQSQNLQDDVDKAEQEMQAKIAEMDDECYKSSQEALNKLKTDLANGGLVNVSGSMNDGTKMNRNIADNPKKILTECLRGPLRMGRIKILINVRLKAEEALGRKKIQLFDRQTKLTTRLSELGTKLDQNKQAAYQKMVNAVQKLDQEKARLSAQMAARAQEDYTAMMTSSTDLQNKMVRANEILNTSNTAKTCAGKIPSTKLTKAKIKDDEDPESQVGTAIGTVSAYRASVESAINICCNIDFNQGLCDKNKRRQITEDGTTDTTPATTPSPSPAPRQQSAPIAPGRAM